MEFVWSYRAVVRSSLLSILKAQIAASDASIGWGRDFVERLELFTVGGKLLRGCLVCFAYELFSGQEPSEAVIQVATALELAHSSLLIHDDIMDKDELRRGKPSMHRQYTSLGHERHLADTEHFGYSMAICGGNAALLMAYRLISEAQATTKLDIPGKLFVDQLLQVCSGQMQDVYFERDVKLPSKSAIMQMLRTKSAAYTIAMPLAIGAALADQPRQTIRQLLKFGEAAGTIFQIRDDALDVSGNPKNIGKSANSDLRRHKKTLLYYYLYKNASKSDRQVLQNLSSKLAIAATDIDVYGKLIDKYNVENYLASDIHQLRRQALSHLQPLQLSAVHLDQFTRLLEFCELRHT